MAFSLPKGQSMSRITWRLRELLNVTPSPRPANATLPTGWHDIEVAQLDMFRQQNAVMPPTADNAIGGTGHLVHEAHYGLGDETPGWDTAEDF